MGLTKAQRTRKALNRVAAQIGAEKRRRIALGDQLDQEQQGNGDDAQQEEAAAAAAEGAGKENEQQQHPDERHLQQLADVAAAAAAASGGANAAGQQGVGVGLQVSAGGVCCTALLTNLCFNAVPAAGTSIAHNSVVAKLALYHWPQLPR
jgi:hypothetical protein